MSIQAKIKPLKTLASIDSELQELDKALQEKKAEMDEKATRHEGLRQRTDHLEQSISAMEGTRNELVQELRQTALLVDKSRDKMARCRNEREANAVQRELEELRRVHRERDQEIQKLVGLIDEARTDLEAVQAEKAEIESLIDETQGASTKEAAALHKQISDKKEARAAAAHELPGMLLRRYEAVRKRRGSAMSAAVNGSCTACNISLPPMLFQQIMQQTDLKDCPSCHRILYFQTQEQLEQDAEVDRAEADRAETDRAETDHAASGGEAEPKPAETDSARES